MNHGRKDGGGSAGERRGDEPEFGGGAVINLISMLCGESSLIYSLHLHFASADDLTRRGAKMLVNDFKYIN